MIKSNSRHPIG